MLFMDQRKLEKLNVKPLINGQFPYSFYFEAYQFDMVDLEKFMWDEFGPEHGECIREYEIKNNRLTKWVCPYADIDEDFYISMWDDYNNNPNRWKTKFQTYEEFLEYIYDGPETLDHCHKGTWTLKYLKKIGYDYIAHQVMFRTINDMKNAQVLLKLKGILL